MSIESRKYGYECGQYNLVLIQETFSLVIKMYLIKENQVSSFNYIFPCGKAVWGLNGPQLSCLTPNWGPIGLPDLTPETNFIGL